MGPLLFLLLPLLAPLSAQLGAEAVRVVRLEAPRAVVRGEPLLLRCLIQLEAADERLYAVKWYKDGREFYRYSPGEPHPLRAFRTDGVDIDEERSNATNVRLRSVHPSSAGKYSCEVTEESPSFMALLDLATVNVIEINRGATQPEVVGLRPRYRPNEEVIAVCRGPFSRPPATLALVLNEKHVNATAQMQAQGRADGWLRPAVQLRTRAVAGPDGRLRIRCVASFLDLFLGRDEKTSIVTGERSRTVTSRPSDADQDLPTVAEPDVESASAASLLALHLLLLLLPPLLLPLPLLLDG